MTDRYATALYCDDIRAEIGNKLSYMGVYDSQLLVPAIPATLPKLCIAVTTVTPASLPFEKIIIRVLKEYEPIAELDMGLRYKKEKSLPTNVKEEDGIFVGRGLLILSPFSIENEFLLRVHVETEIETLKAPGLWIREAPSSRNES